MPVWRAFKHRAARLPSSEGVYADPMATPREERLADNEAMFRIANERMAGWSENEIAGAEKEICFCECADDDCREKISLSKAEYESVRANSRHFLIAKGHEVPDVETVVEDHEEWTVIEKNPEVTSTVTASDPRQA